MNVSVVIPVYNAEIYVRRAVESALQQDECAEVILVEDKSPDNALVVCKKLTDEYHNVHLYQHSGNANKGPGLSRNLGVLKSSYEYVAFLDADDYYLPDRFKKARQIFEDDPTVDGIFEPVACVFDSPEAQRRYYESHNDDIAMLHDIDSSEGLYEHMVSGKHGYIHLDGFVIKKQQLLKAGMFPDLRLHEDTILTLKLALTSKLVPGEKVAPVAMRELHLKNTITRPGIDFVKTRCLAFKTCLDWMKENKIKKPRQNLLKAKYYWLQYRHCKNEKRYLSAIAYYVAYHLLFRENRNH